LDAGEVVNDADGKDAADVGGAAVAEPCAFSYEDIQFLSVSPSHGVFNVAYEEVVGADFA
jgi:hypothetical protein